jgi:hypothetical protein
MWVTERFTYENGTDGRRFSRSFSTVEQQLCNLVRILKAGFMMGSDGRGALEHNVDSDIIADGPSI